LQGAQLVPCERPGTLLSQPELKLYSEPMAPKTLSAGDIARALRAFASVLGEHREAINRLNVYPVPDGDTGTNMALTVQAVVAELPPGAGEVRAGEDAGADGGYGESAGAGGNGARGGGEVARAGVDGASLETVAKAMAHGSLMGARGNSGVILSQVLRGFAAVVGEVAGGGGCELGPADLARALRRAAQDAYAAVVNPVEGTMLTVAKAAAAAAEGASSREVPPGAGRGPAEARPAGTRQAGVRPAPASGGRTPAADAGGPPTLVQVLEAARDAAAKALAGTTEQLPALKAAGVVDAGGAGLVLLYESLLHVADGRPLPAPPESGSAAQSASQSAAKGAAAPGGTAGDLRYEVMFLLEAPDETMPAFKEVWAGVGGSIAVVGGDGLYNCHIHTDDIGAAIEAAIEIGHPRQIRVTDLAEQVQEERWVREAVAETAQAAFDWPLTPVGTAVVAVAAGEGVKRIFRSLGVRGFVEGGQSANPSVAEVVEAIRQAPAESVVVLPNNPNVVPVAEQAAANSGKKARVVATGGIAEGFAALLAYDPEADLDTNADTMAAAAARVLTGEVVRASREAVTEAGLVRPGDWLGVSSQEVKVALPGEAGPAAAAQALLGALTADGGPYDIVTVIEGEGATPAATRQVVEWVAEHLPCAETEVHHGGQPLYAYVLSVE